MGQEEKERGRQERSRDRKRAGGLGIKTGSFQRRV